LKQVVRRQLTLSTAKSKYKRDLVAESILETFGDNVDIMELQGELCFATCEIFMRKISKECISLILSLKKCITMDDGALSLLLMLEKEFQRSHKTLLITDFNHLDLLYSLVPSAPAFLQFPDLDDAVLHLEKTVLFANGYRLRQEPVSLTDQQLLRGLSTAELCELSRYLKHVKFNEGETIIQKGSSAENIYFLESGQVASQDSNGAIRILRWL